MTPARTRARTWIPSTVPAGSHGRRTRVRIHALTSEGSPTPQRDRSGDDTADLRGLAEGGAHQRHEGGHARTVAVAAGERVLNLGADERAKAGVVRDRDELLLVGAADEERPWRV